MRGDQLADRLEKLELWWDRVTKGDPDVMPDVSRREEFIALFKGDAARRVRDGIIGAISGGNPAEAMALNEVADAKERALRKDFASPLEGLIIQDVVILFLSAHEADLRAREIDSTYSLRQASYVQDQRRLARRMLNSAIKLLTVVHQKLAETERLAHPTTNDWRYSTRIGEYQHSRN
jgi:hypothetical protein